MASLIKASIWLTLAELAFNFSGYVTHSLLGRFLGPAEYGRYSLIITFSTMVIVLIGRGVPIAMSKYLSEIRKKNPEKISAIRNISFSVQIVLTAIITLVYYLMAPVFASLLQDETLIPLFRISTFIIPAFGLASFYAYYYSGIHQFGTASFLKFSRGISKVLFILSFGFFLGPAGAIFGHALAPLAVFIIGMFLDPHKKSKLPTDKKQTIPDLSWKKLLNFAWPITLFMIFYEIMISVDLYMVKAFLENDKQTGFYSAALTIGRIPFYAFYFLSIILLPKISEITALGDKKKTKEVLTKSMRFLLMLLIPSVFLLSLFSPSVVTFFYGSGFFPAGTPLSVLVFGMGFLTIFYTLAFVLNGAGFNKIPMWTALLGCLVNIYLNQLLIPKLDILGAAIATSISSLVILLPVYWHTTKKITSFSNYASLFKYLIASIFIYWIGVSFFSQGKFIFILWSLALFGVYFFLLFLLGEINKKDWIYLKEALSKKK